jgi:hypothetical protein
VRSDSYRMILVKAGADQVDKDSVTGAVLLHLEELILVACAVQAGGGLRPLKQLPLWGSRRACSLEAKTLGAPIPTPSPGGLPPLPLPILE